MRRYFSILFLWVCGVTIGHAQTIVRYHYWIDADRLHEKTETVPPEEDPVEINWSMTLTDMTEGTHTLYYRVQDSNSEWSVLNSWQFFVKRLVTNDEITVTKLEYWVDEAKAHYTSMAITDNAASFILDASDMTEGTHNLYYRVQDNEGEWSYLHSWQFFVKRITTNETIKVTDIEYWVDAEKAHYTTKAVSNDEVTFVMDLSDMREGMHTLFYRLKDNEGEWSYLHSWQFFVTRLMKNSEIKVTSVEYWIDSEKAHYATKAVSDDAVAFTMDLSDMREGLHTLCYRFRDNEGGWSGLYTWQFFKVRLREHEIPSVIECEYWLDNISTSTKQTVPVTGTEVLLTFNTLGMKSGTHRIYYRMKDNEGEYGALHYADFEKINPYDPIMILPYETEELDADMKSANPDYMAYPTKLDEQIPEIECNKAADGLGPFSVSSTKKVVFSKGNLQYQASTKVWRFAEHQWSYVGDATVGNVYVNNVKSNNENVSSTYNGWIDLFGWGTSGWNSGAAAYQPWSTNTSPDDYSPGGDANNNLTGAYAKADWGVYNAIKNGAATDPPGTWRTLTYDEWLYVLSKRPNANKKFGAAKVNGVVGVVLLPDDWTLPSGCSFTSGMTSASDMFDWSLVKSTNIYGEEQWSKMEAAGAVFLPRASSREEKEVFEGGVYWSSTQDEPWSAWALNFTANTIEMNNYDFDNGRSMGNNVRLVSNYKE